MERGISVGSVRRCLERMGFRPDGYQPIGLRIDGRARLETETVRRFRLRAADRLERGLRRLECRGTEPLGGAADGEPKPA